jgi:hypothetical protein
MYTVSWGECAVGLAGETQCSVTVQRAQPEPWLNFWERACTEWDAGRQLVSLSLSACYLWTSSGRVSQLALGYRPGRLDCSLWLCWSWGAAETHFSNSRPVGTKEFLKAMEHSIHQAHVKALAKWAAEHQAPLPGW